MLAAATRAHRSGDVARAGQLYEEILATVPDHPDAWHLWGVVAHQQGDHGTALERFARAIALHPNEARYHANRALALHAVGRLDDAEASLRRALDLDPRNGANLFKLGNVLAAAKRPDEAADAYRQARDFDPDNPRVLHNLAVALRETQQFGEAEKAYRRLVALDPRNAEARAGLAVVAHRLGKLDEALGEYRRALELGEGTRVAGAVLAPFGDALLESGQADEAIAAFQRAFAAPSTREEDICRCALAFHRRGHVDQPLALLREAVERRGASARVTAMITYFEAVRAPTDQALERIETLLGDPQLAPDIARSLHLGLARLYHHGDRHDQAFEHARAGNALVDAAYDAEARREFVTASCAVFGHDRIAALPRAEPPSDVPVFIVGMPRSGTTLVEQILASHPQVFGADELPDIAAIARALPATVGSPEPYPQCMGALSPSIAAQLAHNYLDKLTRLGGGAARVTDKLPHNFLYLGLIGCLFPGAHVIHCVRDPIDCGLSNYLQDFDTAGLSYSVDLEHIGHEMNQYQRLMRHWRATLDLPILDVSYEALVDDVEGISRQMVAFCGLEWDQRCLRFNENPRAATSWSAAAVRQPIYRRAVGRAQFYGDRLDPLRRTLATA